MAQGRKQGFCVVGVLNAQGFPVLTKPVKNVTISGLSLTGFTNAVIGFNTEGLIVQHVRADHNLHNGIAAQTTRRARRMTLSPGTLAWASRWRVCTMWSCGSTG